MRKELPRISNSLREAH